MYRIALITDLHLRIGELVYGVDTETNFHRLMEELSLWQLDHLICAGDLSAMEPRKEDLEFVKQGLEKLGLPYDIISGNHDTSREIAEVFGYESRRGEVYYTKVIGERHYIFLDTNQGYISDDQCNWLSMELQKYKTPVVIMHYPPCKSGIPFMDARHKFKDEEKLMSVLSEGNRSLDIFCGHCHAERTIRKGGISIHITPSCITQLNERNVEFQKYHEYVGYRIIEDYGQRMDTFVKYIF